MNLLCALGISCTIVGHAFVLDGDTISVRGQHIRLFGIDAEELSEGYGAKARSALARLIANKPVTCTPTGAHSHHRIVAICRTSHHGDSLNAAMVRSGFALDCARYSNSLYRPLEPGYARQKLTQKEYCK